MTTAQFDLLAAPLTGRTLIEASAGTGKTYTIAALCVRLLVEQELEIDQLLVVTFTEAATAELRDRIRQRIVEAVAVFSDNAEDAALLSPLRDRHPDRSAALLRLKRSLLAFDQAAIHTIHGFCQRVLRDRAFEARALFDTELATDLTALEEELADDFWRQRSAGFAPLFADYLLARRFGPDKLLDLLKHRQRPERILPDTPPPDLAAAAAACSAVFQRLCDLWQRERDVIVAGILAALPGLNKQSYSAEKIAAWAVDLDRLCIGDGFNGAEQAVERFGSFKVNKGGVPPDHPFHALCADFRTARAACAAACSAGLLALQRDYLLWREPQAAARKAHANVRTFDDLLLDVQRLLTAEDGGALLEALRRSFRAVLIDEFQDTDPVQYAIFTALCPDARSSLFLIGDPKQAIYAFRGADIFTYLAATRQVEQRYTLAINRRSAPGLVAGVGRLFRRAQPFLFDEIPYPAVAGDAARNGALAVLDDAPVAPLQLWWLGWREGKSVGKGEATAAIVAAVTAEIVRLLANGTRLQLSAESERPLHAGDIAVLVRSNHQAALLQESLRQAGVAGVRQGTESLFASAEAEELLRLLHALAAPHDAALARAALATPLCSAGAALADPLLDAATFAAWLERLRHYQQLWAGRGVAILSGVLLAREGLVPRLLALPDGERRLTNLRHCFEVLHRAESEEGLGVEGLLKWFSRRVADPPPHEEFQLRLETDARAVQIVTIHRSKGLEYPVCFVPFCWNGSKPTSRQQQEPFYFHLADGHGGRGALALDLGSPQRDAALHAYSREALAENLRLCYVALTRAKARCYLVWGGLKEAETSALAWLLHAPADPPTGAELSACEAACKDLDDGSQWEHLQQFAAVGELAVSEMPQAGAPPRLPAGESAVAELLAPPALPQVANRWRLTSYSALASGAHHPAEGEGWQRAERGEGTPTLADDGTEPRADIHAFPAGAEAGSCLHDILERLDFTSGDSAERQTLIDATLQRYQISRDWSAAVAAMLAALLAAPLDPQVAGLTLGAIPWKDRCSEMGFFLPLAHLDAAELADTFARHRHGLVEPRLPETLARLEFGAVEGLLRGFIDLVFVHQGRYYLIDWKSNRLGRSCSDYHQTAMAEEMLATGYLLQYHLYCVALHRHLQRTLPGYRYSEHFGGVFYLFLRGIDPAQGSTGIFRDRPAEALIADLDRLLAGVRAEHAEE